MKKLSLLAPAFALVLLGAGCASGAPASTLTSTGGSAVADKGVELPADFPKEIPVYVNGKVEDAGSDFLDMVTADSKEVAYEWYAGQLTAAGWKNTSERKEKSIAAVWEKGSQSMPISIYTSGSDTYISVSLSTY